MGWRVRRSVKLMPGLRLNLGLRGLSLTAGVRGASMNFGPRGAYGNLGIPGTGLSYRSRVGEDSHTPNDASREITVTLDLDEQGRLALTSGGVPLDPAVDRRVRRDQADRLRAWLETRCQEIEDGFNSIATVQLETPSPDSRPAFGAKPFTETRPAPPPTLKLGFWARLIPRLRLQREQQHALKVSQFEADLAGWESRRAAHDQLQTSERNRYEVQILSDPTVMEDELEKSLQQVHWPRETQVRFALEEGGVRIVLDVDLPEIEDLPTRSAAIATRGLKLNIHERSEAEIRRVYAAHVHGVVFRSIGLAFAQLPSLRECICSGYSQRRDPRTGHEREDYLLSVRVTRAQWNAIDFKALAYLDPKQCLEGFQLVRSLSASSLFTPIQPLAVVHHLSADAPGP